MNSQKADIFILLYYWWKDLIICYFKKLFERLWIVEKNNIIFSTIALKACFVECGLWPSKWLCLACKTSRVIASTLCGRFWLLNTTIFFEKIFYVQKERCSDFLLQCFNGDWYAAKPFDKSIDTYLVHHVLVIASRRNKGPKVYINLYNYIIIWF